MYFNKINVFLKVIYLKLSYRNYLRDILSVQEDISFIRIF